MGPGPRPRSAWSPAGMGGAVRSSWAQEGPPVLDGCGTGRQVQADAEGMDSGLPASLMLCRRPGPVLSRAPTRRDLYAGEASEVRKDEILGELSRVPESQRRLLPVSPQPESRLPWAPGGQRARSPRGTARAALPEGGTANEEERPASTQG